MGIFCHMDSVFEIIKLFYKKRMNMYEKRLDAQKTIVRYDLSIEENKLRFITSVVDGIISLRQSVDNVVAILEK